jgi:hypothetical protein
MSARTVAQLPDIDHVIDGVYISGVRFAGRQIPALQQAGITSVLKLYPPQGRWPWPDDFTVCDNLINDNSSLPQMPIQIGPMFMGEQIEAEKAVLVACEHGISRSSTFVLAYLVDHGYSLKDAFTLLRTQHPQCSPAPNLWQSLTTFFELPHTLKEIYSWYQM